MGCLEFFLSAWLPSTVSEAVNLEKCQDSTNSQSNLVYIGIFFTVQMAFTLVAASYFAAADGHLSTSIGLKKTGGVFAFLSGLLGYYTVGNLMCQQSLSFSFPMGDTSRFFLPNKLQGE